MPAGGDPANIERGLVEIRELTQPLAHALAERLAEIDSNLIIALSTTKKAARRQCRSSGEGEGLALDNFAEALGRLLTIFDDA